VGLLVSLRCAVRDRASLYVLALLAAAFVPGVVSSYDRSSLTRVYGAMIPLSLLAAAGLVTVLGAVRSATARWWIAIATCAAIAIGGMVDFDVVNPRILSSSTFGILMRSVDEALLDRVAVLTFDGQAPTRPGATYTTRHWEADWLRAHHPYIDDLARCAPKRPVPIISIQTPEKLAGKDLVFWSPALDQTVDMTKSQVCRLWPNAVLYTIADQSGLSRLYGAQIRGPAWTPLAPADRWSTRSCAQIE
jgi:hypothetical protein